MRLDISQSGTIEGKIAEELTSLLRFLERIPSVRVISGELADDRRWWIKLIIDIEHPLAWSAVQELGFVLNYVSLDERLPTVFKPVSPPPYLNGGPKDFLSWVIESTEADVSADWIAEWLEGRLPRPVEDASLWPVNDPSYPSYRE